MDGKIKGKPFLRKGNSLLVAVNDFTIIDIETTGLLAKRDSIIEVSAVRYRNGCKSASFSSLVNPHEPLDDFIVTLTGITDEMLVEAPDIREVLPRFLAFLSNDILIGHNVNFDINFLIEKCALCEIPGMGNDFIDTMRISRRMFPDLPSHSLDSLRNFFDLGDRPAHRALGDCELTAMCYMRMTSDYKAFVEAVEKKDRLKAKDILPNSGRIDIDNLLYQRVCVFTGTLETMLRQNAMQVVTDLGGFCEDNVTKRTNYLILGNNDDCRTIKGGKSNKQKKAEQMILNGAELKIISEPVFIDMVVGNACNTNGKALNEKFGAEILAFLSVKPDLLKVIDENWIDSVKLTFERRATYSSVMYGMNVVVRISAGHSPYISLPNPGKSGEEYRKIALYDIAEITEHSTEICESLQRIVDSYVAEIACCGRYKECSSARACVNPDKEIATDCIYRKHLKAGEIFY